MASAGLRLSRLLSVRAAGADSGDVVAGLGDRVSAPRAVPGLNAFTIELSLADRAATVATLTANPAVRYAEPEIQICADADPLGPANRNSGAVNQRRPTAGTMNPAASARVRGTFTSTLGGVTG